MWWIPKDVLSWRILAMMVAFVVWVALEFAGVFTHNLRIQVAGFLFYIPATILLFKLMKQPYH